MKQIDIIGKVMGVEWTREQRLFLECSSRWQKLLVIWARQTGKTSVLIAKAILEALNGDKEFIVYLSCRQKLANLTRERIENILITLKDEIEFDLVVRRGTIQVNSSTICIKHARRDQLVGFRISLMLLDDFEQYIDENLQNIWEFVNACYVGEEGRVYGISTRG